MYLNAQEQSTCPSQTVMFGGVPSELRGSTIEEHYPLSDVALPLKVTSGGWAYITAEGLLKTIQGDLPESDIWRQKYAHNPDTLYGLRPQNIFRLYVNTCPLSGEVGFYIEAGIVARDFEPPPSAAYRGGFDLIAQWWSPHNPNPAFLCKEQYGGFCGNMGYHGKLYGDGEIVLSRERPDKDSDVNHRYTVLGVAQALSPPGTLSQFELNRPMEMRLEVYQTEVGTTKLVVCADREADGIWERSVSATDTTRPITGSFVPIIRSDWMSAEFFDIHIGTLYPYARSCAQQYQGLPIRSRQKTKLIQ